MPGNKRQIRRRAGCSSYKAGVFTPPSDPPTTVMNPWNRIILTYDLVFPISPPQSGVQPGTYRLHGADIRSQLGTQLGINLADVNLLLKVRKISVWKLTLGPIMLTPTDPFANGDSNALAQIEDSPGRTTWARAAYRYPSFIGDRPWYVQSDSVSHCATIIVASPTDKAGALVHLDLLYKFDTAAWPQYRRFPGDSPASTAQTGLSTVDPHY